MLNCQGKLAEAVRSSVEEWGVGHAESFVGKCMDVCLGVQCACMKKAELVSGVVLDLLYSLFAWVWVRGMRVVVALRARGCFGGSGCVRLE